MFSGFFFWVLDPFILGGHNSLICNLFSTIVSVSNAPRGRVQILFGHWKQWSPPHGSSLPWALECSITGWLPCKTMSNIKPFVKYIDTRSGKTKDPWSNPSEDECTPSSPSFFYLWGSKLQTFSLPFCLNCSLLDLNLVHMLLLHLTWMPWNAYFLKYFCVLLFICTWRVYVFWVNTGILYPTYYPHNTCRWLCVPGATHIKTLLDPG